MLIKIGNQLFDSKDQPIMIITQEEDQQNMCCLENNDYRFCVYPENYPIKKLREFMILEDDPAHGA